MKYQKIYNKIIQKNFQIRMIKKHLKKYIFPKERQKIFDDLRTIIIVQEWNTK